jgi:hypothetical protein
MMFGDLLHQFNESENPACVSFKEESEGDSISWEAFMSDLTLKFEGELGAPEGLWDLASYEQQLLAMGDHLNVRDKIEAFIKGKVDGAGEEDEHFIDGELSILDRFSLAQIFNDGHNLEGVQTMSGWMCNKTSLWAFGGDMLFVSPRFTMAESAGSMHPKASVIDAGLQQSATEGGRRVGTFAHELLGGIADPAQRCAAAKATIERLQQLAYAGEQEAKGRP